MKSKWIILFVLGIIFAIYLQQSYARIYNRVEPNIASLNWSMPIFFKNPTFQTSVKYAALGDSLSFGVGSNDMKKTLPYMFADKLSKQMSVTLYNFSISGATTNDVINNQLNKAAAQRPNYITLLIGTNDLHALTPSSIFEKNMKQIIDYLKNQTAAKIIIFNIPYLGSNSLVLFPYNGFLDYQINQYNNIIADLCKKNKITLIDLYTPTKNQFSKESFFYSSDNFHPSAEGYSLWGTLITAEDI